MTPLLMLWLAGETADVDGKGMMWSLVQTVLIPVGLGLLLRVIASKAVDKVLPVLPWVAIAGIGAVVMAVVSKSQDKLVTVGRIVFVGVAIQNVIGFLFGYYLAKLARERESAARTTAIEAVSYTHLTLPTKA